jgi:streptomycin 6-kinase
MSDSDALDLPTEFVRLNEADAEWLGGLAGLVERLAGRWSLTVGEHFPGIAYNYVAPARRAGADGRATACVLKVSRRIGEAANEIAALRLWDGRGAARLIAADAAIGALLIERVEPGTMLVELAESDDDAATLVVAGLLRRLWEPAVGTDDPRGLRPLESWFAAFDRNRAALSAGDGGFPAALFRRADALRQELLESTAGLVAIHGDMHHYNVLRDGDGWRAIDPKGLAGDRCFDVCQFLRNPRDRPSAKVRSRRLDIFRDELGLERERMKAWLFVHAVLDACWEFEGAAVREGGGGFAHEPNGRDVSRGGGSWQGAVERAEMALSL